MAHIISDNPAPMVRSKMTSGQRRFMPPPICAQMIIENREKHVCKGRIQEHICIKCGTRYPHAPTKRTPNRLELPIDYENRN